MSSLCLSCSSTIRAQDTHKTPCCAAPICAACIARNPRIVDWVPCLRCGDGVGAVKPQRRREDERFVIGDDEEEDGPPAYEDVPAIGSATGGQSTGNESPAESPRNNVPVIEQETTPHEAIRHRIQKGETLRSIAARYAMDPHTLIKLNDLPHTALTTHPTVIHTRKHLLLAPSDLREGSTRPDENVDLTSRWGGDDDDERKAERRAKRFQLVTKTPDPLIAKTYLAISEDDPSQTIFSYSDPPSGSGDEEKEKPRAVVSLSGEEAAVARWFDDEAWEAQQGGANAGNAGNGWFGGNGKGNGKGKGKWVSRGPDPGRAEKGVKS